VAVKKRKIIKMKRQKTRNLFIIMDIGSKFMMKKLFDGDKKIRN
jgi:hypothetical protein